MRTRMCVRACLRECMHGCVRSCVRSCVRACVRACARACVRARVLFTFHSRGRSNRRQCGRRVASYRDRGGGSHLCDQKTERSQEVCCVLSSGLLIQTFNLYFPSTRPPAHPPARPPARTHARTPARPPGRKHAYPHAPLLTHIDLFFLTPTVIFVKGGGGGGGVLIVSPLCQCFFNQFLYCQKPASVMRMSRSHITCNMQHATCNMQRATCNV